MIIVRGIVIAIVIFAAMFGVQAGVTLLQTADSGCLSRNEVNRIMKQAPSAPPTVAADTQTDADAPTPTVDSPPPTKAADTTQGQIDLEREDAKTGLLQWGGLGMIGGLVAAIIWVIFADARHREVEAAAHSVSGRPYWLAFFLIFIVAFTAAALYELQYLGLGPKLSPVTTLVQGALILILGALGYYVSTALGAPKVIRPSVPLSHIMLR
jgi:hypothetical protein